VGFTHTSRKVNGLPASRPLLFVVKKERERKFILMDSNHFDRKNEVFQLVILVREDCLWFDLEEILTMRVTPVPIVGFLL
jgi:hypothetical protein